MNIQSVTEHYVRLPKWMPGDRIAPQTWTSVRSHRIRIPDPKRLVHVQFRRFAGCPVCNLHLQSIAQRHAEIVAEGTREVVVFHSEAELLLRHTTQLPFDVIADPAMVLYRAFRVEQAARALLDPRGWAAIARGIANTLRRRLPLPEANPRGGRFGLPADFLIAPDGVLLAVKYGEHVADQWSVDELLDLAKRARSSQYSPASARVD